LKHALVIAVVVSQVKNVNFITVTQRQYQIALLYALCWHVVIRLQMEHAHLNVFAAEQVHHQLLQF